MMSRDQRLFLKVCDQGVMLITEACFKDIRELFQMFQKPTKTHAELEILLMAELRTYPECNNVDAVAITRPVGRLWGVAVMPDGPLIRPECRNKIWEITERLCNKYDLAQEPLAGTESTIGSDSRSSHAGE